MAGILHFFTNYAILIYLLLVIGLMFATRSLVRARREMSACLYSLERETAQLRTRQALAALSLIVLIAIAELALTVFLAPNLPALFLLATPTMDPLIIPTNTIPPELLATFGVLTPLFTPTAQTTGCIPGQIMITSPKPGDEVKGQVILVGTANIPNFGHFQYEFSPLGTNDWSPIEANPEAKQDEELGRWDTSEELPGDYDLRLVVLDNQGNALSALRCPAACRSPLRCCMPDVQIRSAIATDLPTLMAIDNSCQTEYVWQMDVHHQDGQTGAIFREIRLPRSVSLLYPRPVTALSESWSRRSGLLVSVIGGQPVGYVRTNDTILTHTAWLMDVVVAPRFRRQGIASALVLAAQSWAVQRKDYRALLEMQSKNHPAIRLAQKLGYEFCGYNDQYYETQDIALFFGRFIR